MNITIVTGAFHEPPPRGTGAVEKIWAGLARLFVARGHTVTLIHKRGDEEIVVHDGVRRIAVAGANWSTRTVSNVLSDLVYSIRALRVVPQGDVLVTNTWWLPILAWSVRYRVGSIWVHVARVPRRHFHFYRFVDCVQGVSSFITDRLKRFRHLTDRVVTIPNPVDTETFSQEEVETDGAAVVPIVLYAGRLHPEKGLKLLIQACRLLSSFGQTVILKVVGPHQVAAGGGGDDFIVEMREAAGPVNVEFVPAVHCAEELARLIRGATVCVYPSTALEGEASPLAPLEMMACGRPTVVSSLPQFRDYVEDGENAIVFDHEGPNASMRLAESIRVLLRDPASAASISVKARDTACRLNYNVVSDLYLEAFRKLVDVSRADVE